MLIFDTKSVMLLYFSSLILNSPTTYFKSNISKDFKYIEKSPSKIGTNLISRALAFYIVAFLY